MGRNLKLENLTKRFGKLTAVDHVDLEIEEGEFICFLGPSGCGKTTVLRMITGFETVTEGHIVFDNKVINDLMPKKREFGIVFQSYALFPNMTVEENIDFYSGIYRLAPEKKRERFITPDELPRLWTAIQEESDPYWRMIFYFEPS